MVAEKTKQMIEQREWQEFRELGLLWWVNRILHPFGWVICFVEETGQCFPARCKFRGFAKKVDNEGFKKIQDNFTQDKWHDSI